MTHPEFWQGKRVLLTGHTGFKGAWAALWLDMMGAQVTGYSLAADSTPNFYNLVTPLPPERHIIGDILRLPDLSSAIQASNPEVVIHMAAQSLVRKSFQEPKATFETNVMGTLNLLSALTEAKLEIDPIVLVVTSDKVYENHDSGRAFVETDPLGGDDPYSASKACAEIAAHAWSNSFFQTGKTILATARAGNVIGGGDWSEDRLIPDFIRAIAKNHPFVLRNPASTRPWQHVLDVLNGYFSYIEALAQHPAIPKAMNFGPSAECSITTAELTAMLKHALDYPIEIQYFQLLSPIDFGNPMPEKSYLSINATLADKTLAWKPKLDIQETILWTADWYRAWLQGKQPDHAMASFSIRQIENYLSKPLLAKIQ